MSCLTAPVRNDGSNQLQWQGAARAVGETHAQMYTAMAATDHGQGG